MVHLVIVCSLGFELESLHVIRNLYMKDVYLNPLRTVPAKTGRDFGRICAHSTI